jgi:hypothetical protein
MSSFNFQCASHPSNTNGPNGKARVKRHDILVSSYPSREQAMRLPGSKCPKSNGPAPRVKSRPVIPVSTPNHVSDSLAMKLF